MIHMGNIIRRFVISNGIKPSWLAGQINKSTATIYQIYDRETLDSGLLYTISKCLRTDFFKYYELTENDVEGGVLIAPDAELMRPITDRDYIVHVVNGEIRSFEEIKS